MSTTIWSKLTNLSNNTEIRHEMIKKYKNTILKITYDGKVYFGVYLGTSDDDKYHLFKDLNDQRITLAQDTMADVRVWFPRRGLYNVKWHGANRMICFIRTPYRQYRKGINAETCYIFDPVSAVVSGIQSEYSTNLVGQIADNVSLTRHIDEAIVKLTDKTSKVVSIAFNRRWGISLNYAKNDDIYPLFLYDKHVANINKNKIEFLDKAFIQELLDEDNKDWYQGYAITHNAS